jgi:hypothetical protein
MGVGVRAEGLPDVGARRLPAEVAAAARGKRRGGGSVGQHANLGSGKEPGECAMGLGCNGGGRRRGCSGSGGNGGGRSSVARLNRPAWVRG